MSLDDWCCEAAGAGLARTRDHTSLCIKELGVVKDVQGAAKVSSL